MSKLLTLLQCSSCPDSPPKPKAKKASSPPPPNAAPCPSLPVVSPPSLQPPPEKLTIPYFTICNGVSLPLSRVKIHFLYLFLSPYSLIPNP